jgi:septal ring factor EnvC (AmiA/AmiB activator)
VIANGLKYFLSIICLITLHTFSHDLYAQTNTHQLEKQKSRLEKSIEYADYLIDDARKEKTATLQDLTLLQSKIDDRKKLINNYLEEQNLIFDTIFSNMIIINQISEELNVLKEEYALMINSAYINHNFYRRLVYVLSAGDLNQAYSRFNYYKYYARQRNAQIEHIKSVEDKYFARVESLESRVDRTQQLLAKLNAEHTSLEQEVLLKNIMVKNLNARVDQLIAEQKKNKKSADKLQAEIRNTLAEHTITDAHNASPGPELIETPSPDELELSTGFNENYGKLPWPLERAIISAGFGEQSHPELADIKIKNNGINFLTHENAKVYSVFNGKVTRVLTVPNYNNVVILRHGNFLSVYSNLGEVYVKPGMVVETAQKIGVVFTDEESMKTELHFEIWNGKEIQDPALWIARVNPEAARQPNVP